MSKWEKLLAQILRGSSDTNVSFEDLCNLLIRLGFERRTSGSYNIFRRADVVERPNLQREGNKAKPYQVRQVRNIILRYRLGDKI